MRRSTVVQRSRWRLVGRARAISRRGVEQREPDRTPAANAVSDGARERRLQQGGRGGGGGMGGVVGRPCGLAPRT
jgi:hypothetical protein